MAFFNQRGHNLGYISEAAVQAEKFHRKGPRKRGERSRGWVVYTCPSLLTSFAHRWPANTVTNRWTSRLVRDETRFTMLPPWNSIVPGAFRHQPLLRANKKFTLGQNQKKMYDAERRETILEQGFGIGSPSIFRSSSRDKEEEEKSRGGRRVKGVLKRTPRDDLRWKWIDRLVHQHIDSRSTISRLLPRQQAIRAILRRIITRYTDD